MDAEVEALKSIMTAQFDAIQRRWDDMAVVQTERHAENVRRLMLIEQEARTTNGRVTKSEQQIIALQRWWIAVSGATIGGFGAAVYLLQQFGLLHKG
jgi:2-polyprenyl-3-methyl-5-hydroxy-6-metoxy-1,4-benzoquinol methylase